MIVVVLLVFWVLWFEWFRGFMGFMVSVDLLVSWFEGLALMSIIV